MLLFLVTHCKLNPIEIAWGLNVSYANSDLMEDKNKINSYDLPDDLQFTNVRL